MHAGAANLNPHTTADGSGLVNLRCRHVTNPSTGHPRHQQQAQVTFPMKQGEPITLLSC